MDEMNMELEAELDRLDALNNDDAAMDAHVTDQETREFFRRDLLGRMLAVHAIIGLFNVPQEVRRAVSR
jgi:hypothetical protein